MPKLTPIFDKSNVAGRKKNTQELNQILAAPASSAIDMARVKELLLSGIDLKVMHEHKGYDGVLGYSNAVGLCAVNGHSEILQLIIYEGKNGRIDLNLDEPALNHITPLEWTLRRKDYNTMKILADNGADFKRAFKLAGDSLLNEVKIGGELYDPKAEKILFAAYLRRQSSGAPKKTY